MLAVIRNPDFVQLQQDYLETRSQLKFAKAEYERQGELYRQEVAPQKNYQRAQAEYEAMQVKTSAQAARLRFAGLPVGGAIVTTAALRTPKSGFVKAVNVSVGQSVTPTDVLFEIVDPEHLHVELTVFEKDIPQVKEKPARALHPGQRLGEPGAHRPGLPHQQNHQRRAHRARARPPRRRRRARSCRAPSCGPSSKPTA